MEKLLCKLIALFITISLAVSAQASLIANDSPEYKAIAKGSFAAVSRLSDWTSSDATNQATASPFSGNLLSIFQHLTTATKPVYEVVFAYDVRDLEIEKSKFSLDISSAAENLLDRVKVKIRVSESGSIMLFAVGLFSLAMTRRKMKMKA